MRRVLVRLLWLTVLSIAVTGVALLLNPPHPLDWLFCVTWGAVLGYVTNETWRWW